VGGSDNAAMETVISLYRHIENKRDELAGVAGIAPVSDPPASQYFATNRTSAELIKVTANAFLALKISFANSIAKLADATGADIKEVMDVVGADRRIGRAFLDAGRGYGGGCFPKDVTGLISSATKHGVDLGIMTAASDLNETMPGYIANKIYEQIGELRSKKVAVLGLSFKSGTSDARKSPGVKLANILSHAGATVRAYDPQANGEAEAELRKGTTVCHSLEDAVKGCNIVCITTAWPEFLEVNLSQLADTMEGDIFVDAENAFSKEAVVATGLTYVGVGR
jgi:UDPglucose 6-dehydrogenase